jgi:hypothetical protein
MLQRGSSDPQLREPVEMKKEPTGPLQIHLHPPVSGAGKESVGMNISPLPTFPKKPAEKNKASSMTVSGASAATMLANLQVERKRQKKKPRLRPMQSLRHYVQYQYQERFDTNQLPRDLLRVFT